MPTGPATLQLGELAVTLLRKKCKLLRIRVHPPDGRVTVTAPMRTPTYQVLEFLESHRAWIHTKRDEMLANPQVMPTGQLGAWVSLWGDLMRIEDGAAKPLGDTHGASGHPGASQMDASSQPAKPARQRRALAIVQDGRLIVHGAQDDETRLAAIERWQREALHAKLTLWVPEWAERMGVQPTSWRIRRMRTRWGSCNTVNRTLLFALSLAQHPPHLGQYVVVHELAHLLVRNHSVAFNRVMDRTLPDWAERKAELNRPILAPRD